MVDKCLLLLITNAPCSLKTPQTGFHFYVSPLHLKTTHSLGSFIRETQCKMFKKAVSFKSFSIMCVCYISLNSASCFSSTPKSVPSFQRPVFSDSVPNIIYIQGNPMYTSNEQYFTIPQVGLMHTVSSTVFLK